MWEDETKTSEFFGKTLEIFEKTLEIFGKMSELFGAKLRRFYCSAQGLASKLVKSICVGCGLWRTECVCSRVSQGLGGNELEEVLPILVFDHGLRDALHVGSGEPSLAVGDAFETSHFETLTFLQHLNISGGF